MDIKKRGVVSNPLPEKPIHSAPIPVSAPIPTPAPAPVATAIQQPAPRVPQESSEETLGRTLGVIGIFAVLFGVAFFLKYAFETGLIGINGRLILGALVGMLGLVFGRMLKAKYENYSYILSGGGIGILFVTTYTAHVLYDVISAPVSYFIFGVITAISIVLSIKDGKMLMAALGISAGFLAPLLVSIEVGSFIPLFTYMLIMNAGVAVISYTYKWPILTYIAFIGTFVSVTSWNYRIEGESLSFLFASFATLYFLIFLASSIFHHVVRKEKSTGGDVAFVTMNVLQYLAVVYPVLSPLFPDGMGIFVAIIGLLYFAVGYLSFTTHKEDVLLNTALPMLGVLLLTVAIPLHFDGPAITIAWLVEALALALIDYRINGNRLYKYSMILYFLGLFRLFAFDSYDVVASGFIPVFNMRFFAFAVAIASGLLIAYVIHRAVKESPQETENLQPLPVFLGVVTQLTTLFLFTSEIHYYFSMQASVATAGLENTVISIVWALYAALLTVLGFVYHSKVFRVFGMALFIVTAVRIFLSLWELGPLYRIVTSIIFGIIALAASFLYAKYKEKVRAL